MKTVTEYFEEAKEPLRTMLLENFNRKATNGNLSVPRLAEAITMGIDWANSNNNSLFSKLYDLGEEEAIYKYLENYKEYFEYKAKIFHKKDSEYYVLPPRSTSVSFSTNTFQNCQNFTIGNFQGLLQNVPKEDLKYTIRYFKDAAGGKRLLVVDVNRTCTTKIKELFNNIVAETPYLSTNGSNMVMFIINVTEF